MKKTRILNTPWAAAALAVTALTLANPAAHAATVWNVNMGDQLTTADNYIGAAPENTVNSTWNSIITFPKISMALKDSTGSSSAGVTIDISAVQGDDPDPLNNIVMDIGYPGEDAVGDEIFNQYLGGFGMTASMTIKGLTVSATYDLIVYSDWYWAEGDSGYPVTQTLGTGLSGTVVVNHDTAGAHGFSSPLAQDTNPADVEGATNWYRITGLTPDSNGHLGFQMGDGANAPLSGFQLVEVSAIPEPSSSALLGGLFGLALLRRRR